MTNTGSVARQLRKTLPAYLQGDEAAISEAWGELERIITEEPDDHDKLLCSIAEMAVKARHLGLLQKLVLLDSTASFSDQAVICADIGWREGYQVLREAMRSDSPLAGLILYSAFKMDDPDAWDRPDCSKLLMAQNVEIFLQSVRSNGDSSDDAVEFLTNLGLAWAINFGLGLENEWGDRGDARRSH